MKLKEYVIADEKGFTLIESMVAIFILTIGLFSLYAMQINAINGNAKASRITYGTGWTTDRIENLITLPFDDVLLEDGDGDGTGQDGDGDGIADNLLDFGLNDTGNNADGSMVSPDGMYTLFWNVAEGQRMPDLKSIRIIVRYNGGADTRDIVMDYIKPRM